MSELRKIKALMDKKFGELREELQGSCPHDEISDWMEEHWTPGHASGFLVKQCKRCGKEIERSKGWITYESGEMKVHVMSPEEVIEEETMMEEAFKSIEEDIKKAQKEGKVIRV